MSHTPKSDEDLASLYNLVSSFLKGFERLYVQNDPAKVSRCRLCIWQLIHVPIHIAWNGSIRFGSQATCERANNKVLTLKYLSRFPLRPPGRRRVSELGQPLMNGKKPSIGISHRMSTLMTGRPASSRRAQRTGWREIAELPFRYERRGNACERVKWRLPIRFGG